MSDEQPTTILPNGQKAVIANQAVAPAAMPDQQPDPLAGYIIVLTALRKTKRHLTVAPTFVPRNFADQIQYFDDGVTRKVYFYINNVWRSVTVT